MARSDGSSSGPPDGNGYKVGYKRPPREYCFRPGQSGNPTGKRKERAVNATTVSDLILLEIHRPMQVREGDKVISLPAIQAAMRAHMMNAAKGDRKAFTDALGLVLSIESKRSDEQMKLFASALDYKLGMEKELVRRKREGIVAPDPLPHPDDIVINPRTGTVEIKGPIDACERALLEDLRDEHAELANLLLLCEAELASTRSKKRRSELRPVIKRINARLTLLEGIVDLGKKSDR